MNVNQIISARVSSETKGRFRALAERQQLSESALLNRLVEMTLHSAGPIEEKVAGPDRRASRGARVWVRLRAEDRLLLTERAAARGMPAATYVSVLARAHLRKLAPLPEAELDAMQRSVAELGAIGRNLNQIARAPNAGGRPAGPGPWEAQVMLKICEGLRDHMKALIKSNLVSWDLGHADTNQ